VAAKTHLKGSRQGDQNRRGFYGTRTDFRACPVTDTAGIADDEQKINEWFLNLVYADRAWPDVAVAVAFGRPLSFHPPRDPLQREARPVNGQISRRGL
jgi:hypothetical protein